MKKIFALLLALAMVFTLMACSDDSDGKAKDGGSSASGGASKEFESFSVDAANYFLEEACGISFSEIEPDWEYEFKNDYCVYGDDPGNTVGHAAVNFTRKGDEISDEETNAYFQKIFDLTAKVSDDGYNIIGHEFVGEGEDAFAEVTLEDALGGFLQGWGFKKDGKLMVVYASTGYDKEKDSKYDRLFYYDTVEIDIGFGLQQSWDDTMDALEEHADEIEDALS